MTQQDLLVIHGEVRESATVQHRLQPFRRAGVLENDVVEERHRQFLTQPLPMSGGWLVVRLGFEDVRVRASGPVGVDREAGGPEDQYEIGEELIRFEAV